VKDGDFYSLLDRRLDKIQEVLASKAEEYSADFDRLYNFKAAAGMNGGTPGSALWGMLTKHLVNVRDLAEGRLEATPERVDEKIGDAINYLILLEAVLKEEKAK